MSPLDQSEPLSLQYQWYQYYRLVILSTRQNVVHIHITFLKYHYQLKGGGDAAILELVGENLQSCLQVWFGDVEAEMVCSRNSDHSLQCIVPDISHFYPSNGQCLWSQPTQVRVLCQ